MTSKATASVCIVTYNSASDIETCIEAVLRQSYPVKRIVVVDNASADHTVEVVGRFGDPVHLMANKENVGFAAGQNQAIRHADADYMLVLNPDVELGPDYVRLIVDWMERHPDTGSATGQLVLASDPSVMDSAGIEMDWKRRAWDLGGGEQAADWERSRAIFGVSGAAAVYSRKMIEDISMDGQFFDEAYFAYKEDVDVAWRAQLLGWSSHYVAEAKAVHKRGWKYEGRQSRKRVPLFLRRHSYQNRLFTIVKNEPLPRLLLNLPRLAALELAQAGYIVLFEPGLAKCWLTILRRLPRLLRQRYGLQKRISQRR